MQEIAIIGIDGSGKTTLAGKISTLFEAFGEDVGYIDVPYFTHTRLCRRCGVLLARIWRFADARGIRPVLIVLGVAAALLYFVARWEMRGRSTVLVEHHPRIDMYAYGALYGGRLGAVLARRASKFWPCPKKAILLTTLPVVAYERLIKRGKPLQIHENPEDLQRLEVFLRQALEASKIEYHAMPAPSWDIFRIMIM